ncbi:FtsX-like permease family protein [Streptacidiphilus sp. P02-A3a]|uniref:FtsX-like permease family protein n=1 Tax=Streptacidiphilus sp. P02-A3a TaxID=2704468 RepID=UPI001CDD8989|nr:FtsX-like permease family protein [Streptacidiphilus sp. P02-A3a]
MTVSQFSHYLLGMRLACTGGRGARIRLLLSALAVGLGVALLLAVAAIPGMAQHRNERLYSQYDTFYGSDTAPATSRSVLIGDADTVFQGQSIRGRVVHPDGPDAPLPPGVAAYPAPGRMVVSPALKALLSAPGSALLRARLPYPVTGGIGQAGLLGPGQLSFVLGSDHLSLGTGAVRIDQYGHYYPGKPMSPVLLLLCLVGFVVMLAPVGVFLGAAARFGGEQRDRRLAALRLCGADRRMTARVAAGESLAGALLGLAAGVLLFLLGRQWAQSLSVQGVSFFARDISPQPLPAALVVVSVPVLAVAATLLAMRAVSVDPLGVVRRGGERGRRLWWRLLLPWSGLAVLLWAVRDPSTLQQNQGVALASGGLVLLLAGVAALLPWLLAAVTRRIGGGALSWQLAVRRLQHHSGSAANAVGGIVVAVAGAIALQALFAGVATEYAPPPLPPAQTTGYQAQVTFPQAAATVAEQTARFRDSPDVKAALGFTRVQLVGGGDAMAQLVVADCETLRAFAALPHCADGDFFVAHAGRSDPTGSFRTGSRVGFGLSAGGDPGPAWRLPAPTAAVTAGPDPLRSDYADGGAVGEFLATPGAVPTALLGAQGSTVYIDYDQGRPDALDQLRTDAALVSPLAVVSFPGQEQQVNHNFSIVSRALAIGAAVTLLLIAASLLVGMLEQLRERRRVLAVLYAFGAARRVLALSVLWQSLLPMALGLLLAVSGGLALGGVLLHLAALPVSFDWGGVGLMAGLGALSVLLVTALSLPPLLRLMRPGALRHE